jgi:hypothetical protein
MTGRPPTDEAGGGRTTLGASEGGQATHKRARGGRPPTSSRFLFIFLFLYFFLKKTKNKKNKK